MERSPAVEIEQLAGLGELENLSGYRSFRCSKIPPLARRQVAELYSFPVVHPIDGETQLLSVWKARMLYRQLALTAMGRNPFHAKAGRVRP